MPQQALVNRIVATAVPSVSLCDFDTKLFNKRPPSREVLLII